ncbi:hypothetical protein [Streptomyces venezuelae]|uniref:hypothetical protein n=1 Tax=Streptomyces venezuelae TaxID=54571 RepID=UPI001680826E|nr:hypothetical protein [Streptomyces venezuelae]
MFAYEIAATRRADLIRQADAYRQAQQAKRARRGAARGQEPAPAARDDRNRFTTVA